jgi:hypothetical protein
MVAGEGRSDLLLAAGVVVLLVARFAWAGSDGFLELSFLLALGASVVLCGLAAASPGPLGSAVRALLAAIAYFTFTVDPTTGWDERNVAYGLCGTLFAAVAVVRAGRRSRIEGAPRTSGPAAHRAVAAATWVGAALLLAGAATFVAVIMAVFWALSRNGSS